MLTDCIVQTVRAHPFLTFLGKRGPKGERGDPGKPHPGQPGPPGIQGDLKSPRLYADKCNASQQEIFTKQTKMEWCFDFYFWGELFL